MTRGTYNVGKHEESGRLDLKTTIFCTFSHTFLCLTGHIQESFVLQLPPSRVSVLPRVLWFSLIKSCHHEILLFGIYDFYIQILFLHNAKIWFIFLTLMLQAKCALGIYLISNAFCWEHHPQFSNPLLAYCNRTEYG